MRLHCDHCRKHLGASVQRYWHMRFCSATCRDAYQQRLDADTRAKIRRLDEPGNARGMIGRAVRSRLLDGAARHLPG
jgi:hypothetical protein